MSPRFLADANVLSEPLKPSPNPSVLRQIEKNRADLVTAAPVWHELLYGCDRLPESKRRAWVNRSSAGALPVPGAPQPRQFTKARRVSRYS